MLTVDEVRNIIHRTRTIEGIHGDQIFEGRRLQFAQVLLHSGRFKLECSDGTSVTI